MKLGGRCIIQKSRPSSNLGVIARGNFLWIAIIWSHWNLSDHSIAFARWRHIPSLLVQSLQPTVTQALQRVACGYDVGKNSAGCLVSRPVSLVVSAINAGKIHKSVSDISCLQEIIVHIYADKQTDTSERQDLVYNQPPFYSRWLTEILISMYIMY